MAVIKNLKEIIEAIKNRSDNENYLIWNKGFCTLENSKHKRLKSYPITKKSPKMAILKAIRENTRGGS